MRVFVETLNELPLDESSLTGIPVDSERIFAAQLFDALKDPLITRQWVVRVVHEPHRFHLILEDGENPGFEKRETVPDFMLTVTNKQNDTGVKTLYIEVTDCLDLENRKREQALCMQLIAQMLPDRFAYLQLRTVDYWGHVEEGYFAEYLIALLYQYSCGI